MRALAQISTRGRTQKLRGEHHTVHKVEIDVGHVEVLQGRRDTILDAVMPCVVELCGDPDLRSRHARVLDSFANLFLVTISKRSVMQDERTWSHGLASCVTHVSMCLYPAFSASLTAYLTSLGLDCHVPRPILGIFAPVLRVKDSLRHG